MHSTVVKITWCLLINGVLWMNSAAATLLIITIDQDENNFLSSISKPVIFDSHGLEQAQSTVKNLTNTLLPLMPAAGLAAPQIGLNEQIFIFSWNRQPENIQAVLNPDFVPLDEVIEASWEACFSCILCKYFCEIAYVPRYKNIQTIFYDDKGCQKKWVLQGFAAKVFQHEYDHIKGIVNIHKPGAQTKRFISRDVMNDFLDPFKKTVDAVHYIAPKAE